MAHLAERHLAVQQDFPGYINTFYKVLLCVERNIVKSVLLHVKPPSIHCPVWLQLLPPMVLFFSALAL